MAEESKTETTEAASASAAPADGSGPCDVFPPRAGCCGGGRAWIWLPTQMRWMCKQTTNCP